MTNLSKIIKGGGVGVPVFTEAQLDNELAAGTKNILIEDVITITTPKILATNNVKIISVKKEAGLIDDGNFTAPLFTIDAENVALSGLNIQCNSDIFNVIDLTANACKCEISNCTIKSDVINVINLHENSSNNIISNNVLQQIDLSTAFKQKGPEGGIPEVLNDAALGSSGICDYGYTSDISANGEIMVVSSYGYEFDHPDPNLRGKAFAKVFKLVNNQWESLGEEFVSLVADQYEFTVAKINAEGTRVVFLGNGDFADITIYDLNEGVNPPQWVLNTSNFTNPINQVVTTGIIQDVPAYRSAIDINDQGNIIAAIDFDGIVTVYEEINNEWVQKGPDISQSFYCNAEFNLKLDSSGNTFLVAKNANSDNIVDGTLLLDSGGFDVFTYNGNEWVRKGSEIVGLAPYLNLGSKNFDSPCGISGDGNVVVIQGEIGLKTGEFGRSASKGRFIQEYNFKNIDDIVDFKNILPVEVQNVIFNSNDDNASFVVNLVYKYNETLMDWEVLDIVTLQSSLNDFLTENALRFQNVRRNNRNIGINYHGNVLCINTSQRQLTVYQLNTKTKTYEQSSRLQGLELDFSNYATTPEELRFNHLALNGLSNNGKHFYSSFGGASFTNPAIPGFAVVFDVGLKPNILDFGINNELSGNSFEKEKRIQPAKFARSWNSYSIGIYRNPSDTDDLPSLNYIDSSARALSSYDEVFVSNAASPLRCPKPEKGARVRIFVMDTVVAYNINEPNAVIIKPFDTEFIISAGVPFDSNSPFGGFKLIPGNAYEFGSDGTNWFVTGGYDNSFVDSHLNTNTAVDNQFLSYDITTQNYTWVTPVEPADVKEIIFLEGLVQHTDLSVIEENKIFIINDIEDANSVIGTNNNQEFNNCDFILNHVGGVTTIGTTFQSSGGNLNLTFNNCNFIIKDRLKFRDINNSGSSIVKFNNCSFSGKVLDFGRLKQTTLILEYCKIQCDDLALRGDFYDFTNCDVQVGRLFSSAASNFESPADSTLIKSVVLNKSNFNVGACLTGDAVSLQITTNFSNLNIKEYNIASFQNTNCFIDTGTQSKICILKVINNTNMANYPAIKIGSNSPELRSKLSIESIEQVISTNETIDIVSTTGTTIFTMQSQFLSVKFIGETLVFSYTI